MIRPILFRRQSDSSNTTDRWLFHRLPLISAPTSGPKQVVIRSDAKGLPRVYIPLATSRRTGAVHLEDAIVADSLFVKVLITRNVPGSQSQGGRRSRTTLLQVSSHLILPSSSGWVPQDAPILNVGVHPGLDSKAMTGASGARGPTVSRSSKHLAMAVSWSHQQLSDAQVFTTW